jgi:hypothetical protein
MAKKTHKKRTSKKRKSAKLKSAGNIEKAVMEKIEKGEVKMRPKNYFLLKNIIANLLLLIISILAVLTSSYSIYKLRSEQSFGFVFLGRYGLITFIRIFPWASLILVGITMLILIQLLKGFKRRYKINSTAIGLMTICVVLVLSSILDFAGLNRKLAKVRSLQKYFVVYYITDNSILGDVVGIETSGLVIRTPDGKRVKVLMNSNGNFINSRYDIGDKVKVAGYWSGTTFNATAVGK